MRAFFASAAAVLAVAPTVAATGQAIVKNKCNFPVYLWSVANTDGSMHTLDANSGEYSETYRENPNGGGISIKMARSQDYYTTSVAQFEYTLGSTLWYDLSDINGNPFMDYGYTLVPSQQSCRNIVCKAGDILCKAVYNAPDDNEATAACTNDANTVLVLCSGQTTDDSVSSEASSVAAGGIGAAITPIASLVNNIIAPSAASPTVNVAAVSSPAAQVEAASTPVTSAAPVVASQVIASPVVSSAPASSDSSNDGSGDVIVTTFVTQYAQATAVAGPNSQPQWAGHHLASEGWDFHPDSKVKRHHQHHQAHEHAAAQS